MSPTHTRLSRVADGCALITAAVGLLAVAGWLLNIDSLMRVLPGLVAMKFNTALAFVLAGGGLWWRRRVLVRSALAALVALMGALSLAEHLVGLDLRIDSDLRPRHPCSAGGGISAGPDGALHRVLLSVAGHRVTGKRRCPALA